MYNKTNRNCESKLVQLTFLVTESIPCISPVGNIMLWEFSFFVKYIANWGSSNCFHSSWVGPVDQNQLVDPLLNWRLNFLCTVASACLWDFRMILQCFPLRKAISCPVQAVVDHLLDWVSAMTFHGMVLFLIKEKETSIIINTFY